MGNMKWHKVQNKTKIQQRKWHGQILKLCCEVGGTCNGVTGWNRAASHAAHGIDNKRIKLKIRPSTNPQRACTQLPKWQWQEFLQYVKIEKERKTVNIESNAITTKQFKLVFLCSVGWVGHIFIILLVCVLEQKILPLKLMLKCSTEHLS